MSTVEQQCLFILSQHMGPAAKGFLERQCRGHLHKEPMTLQRNDIEELAKWCQIGTQLVLGLQVGEKVKQGLLSLK
jgi:hypothetical protein